MSVLKIFRDLDSKTQDAQKIQADIESFFEEFYGELDADSTNKELRFWLRKSVCLLNQVKKFLND